MRIKNSHNIFDKTQKVNNITWIILYNRGDQPLSNKRKKGRDVL